MKRLLLFLALPIFAQQFNSPTPICQVMNCYTASTGNVSLSGAGTAATIQQPTSCAGTTNSNTCQQVVGIKASVYCSVACVVTRSKDGTAATATAAQSSIIQSSAMPAGKVTPLVLFYTASNASGGTTVDVTNVPAGTTLLYDLSDVTFGTNPSQTYTISVGSITGTANITYYMGLK
jgi:hypothetical protein